MRHLSAVLIFAALLPAPVFAARTPDTADKALAGRVAGKPQACITRTRTGDNSRITDDHAMIYDGYGSTVYLNRPALCDALRSDRGIVSVTPSDQICRGDIIQVVSFQSGFNYGACAMGDFVPYTKPKR